MSVMLDCRQLRRLYTACRIYKLMEFGVLSPDGLVMRFVLGL